MSSTGSAELDRNGGEWSKGCRGIPPPPRSGAGVLLGSLTLNILSLGLPVVILQVYDRIVPNQATETFALLILGLTAVLLLDGFLRVTRSHIAGWEAARFGHAADSNAVDRLLATDIRSFERDPPGVHLDRLQAITTLRDFHAGQAKLLIIDLPFILLFLGLIWLIAGSLVLVLLGLLVLLAAGAFLVGRALQAALQDRTTLDERRYNFIIEVIGGILTAKSLAMEPLLLRRYERLQESGASTTYQVTYLSNLGQSVGALFSNLTMIAVATVGATYIIAGELTVGGLAACTLLAGRTIQPLLRALGLWTQFQNISLAEKRAKDLFELEPEAGLQLAELGQLEGRIELKDLSFGYEEEGARLLDDINLTVEPGEVVGISGDTGSGKSTLLLLMTGALTPDAGQVLFDEQDIAQFDPQSLRRQIGFMPQSACLFQGSILENVTMFRRGEADDKALEAMRLLGLDRQIHRLPMGYDTLVGDGGQDELPGGLTCGIVMARALVGQPKVLLFDEANAALDAKSDANLKEALGRTKGGPTMVLISQRPSLLALADRIFDLREGELVERERPGESGGKKASPGAAPAGSKGAMGQGASPELEVAAS